MKNMINQSAKLSILSLMVLASSVVSAAQADEPCKQIKSACEAGGFVKGGHKKDNKGLYKDCVQKIMAGESVANVSVPAEVVSSCKAKKEKRAAAKSEKKSG